MELKNKKRLTILLIILLISVVICTVIFVKSRPQEARFALKKIGKYQTFDTEKITNWDRAVIACHALGMRLPIIDELKDMHGKWGAPVTGYYWSSTVDEYDRVRIFSFNGPTYAFKKDYSDVYVMCIEE